MRATSRLLAYTFCLSAVTTAQTTRAVDEPSVGFDERPGQLVITIGGKPFATYVYNDEKILRPYFCNVVSPSGIQATRHHPLRPNKDSTDHPTMHPGIGLAFADINGADFWRNRARVEHIGFVQEPRTQPRGASFAVRNRYVAGDKTVCTEICRHTILLRPAGYLLIYDSTFRSDEEPFTFGDQEEFGLGIRVASPLRVRGGNGRILNSDGLKNERQVWGKQADWCDYSGTIGDYRVGIMLMPHIDNFRRSWFHARDYGFVAANPFGRNALSGGKKSKVTVSPSETFRLRFAVLVYSQPKESELNLQAVYKDFLKP